MDLRLGGLLLAPERGAPAWPQQHFPLGPAAHGRTTPERPRKAIGRPLLIAAVCALLAVGYWASDFNPAPFGFPEILCILLAGGLGCQPFLNPATGAQSGSEASGPATVDTTPAFVTLRIVWFPTM